LVSDNKLSLQGYLRQCAYLGISMSLALAAVGIESKADASTDLGVAVPATAISTEAAAEIANLIRPASVTDTEIDIAGWYDWGDWGDWGDWWN
tara:strand:- start:131 stop:409 length:279 start_codon:yes stop_codon:yes gene_type:complete